MIYTQKYFENFILNKISTSKKEITIVLTCPYELYTLESINEILKLNIVKIIFVGENKRIIDKINKHNLKDLLSIQIVDAISDEDAAIKTMILLKEGKANVLMKGKIETSLLLKNFLSKEYELKTNQAISHVCLSFKEGYDKFFIITDAALNIKPNLEQKKQIINNAVTFARFLGIEKPNVANLCAKEKAYEKMPNTMDAQMLHEMYLKGEFNNCVVSGPLQIDLAVSEESAKIKGCKDPVAGKANVLMCPDIESANILSKALTYISGFSFAGILIGAKIPMILTSRSSSERDQKISILLACLVMS